MQFKSIALCLSVVLLAYAAVSVAAPVRQAISAPGLIGHYRSPESPDESTVVRIDSGIAFDWADGAPDARLSPGRFSATWEGRIRIPYPGSYRLDVQGTGKAQVFLQGRQVFPGPDGEPNRPIPLIWGDYPIRVCYEAPTREARIHLLWSSDSFPAEVVNPRYLSHDLDAERSIASHLAWNRGREIVQRYGCARCHPIPGIDRSIRPGLPMPHVVEMKPEWVAAWLRDPQAVRPGTRMGSPGGTPQQMEELISNLLALVEHPEVRERIEAKWNCDDEVDPLDEGSIDEAHIKEGRQRFYELGCSACHAPETPNSIDPTRGPSLADIGSKWPKAYLRKLILDPVGRHPCGGNPAYELERADVDRLIAYLSTITLPKRESMLGAPPSVPPKTELKLLPGQSLLDPTVLPEVKAPFLGRLCHNCHSPEGKFVDGPVLAPTRCESEEGCLRSDRAKSWAPQYHLKNDDRAAVIEFLSHPVQNPSPIASGELARRMIHERFDCLACHRRNGTGGEQLAGTLVTFLSNNLETRSEKTTPPDLSGVGTRLLRPWMLQALDGKAQSNRPWLTVKMPGFGLSEEMRNAIADRLAVEDLIPGLKRIETVSPSLDLPNVAHELIGERGFNCTNCHCFRNEDYSHDQLGPNLSLAAKRIGRDWFCHWFSGPSRILPETPMPTFSRPVQSIAGGQVLTQREIIWRYLKYRAKETPDSGQ